MGKNLKISAIIIYATDCDKNLFDMAKKSVSWCDELVLVNGVNGSFNDWRNEGLKKAKGDWVLYLDTDEEISENLKIEICKLIDSKAGRVNWKSVTGDAVEIDNFAYAIPRRNKIFGKEFKYSGQYPDYQKRLFQREKLKKWTGQVHEEPQIEGEIGHLKNPMLHHKNMTLSEMVDKTNIWSEIEAELMFKANHPPMNIFRFASAGFREFWLRFVKQMAFLDGKEGIIYGIYQIYSRLISYSKLWEKQQKI